MPDIWMNVDAALSEVPINLLALIDDTDFKTREESVVYNQAGMDLVWNFVTSTGAMAQTAVTPTTGGDYDWVNQGNGMYSIEIPASGGASINNDAEGVGWFTGFATGILPWRSPTIGFRAAAVNDALIDGGDYLQVDAVQIEGVDATNQINAECDTALTDYDGPTDTEMIARTLPTADYFDPDNDAVANVTLVTTTTTNTDMVGTDNAALASVCTEARLAELAAANLPTDIDAILADTDELQTDDVPGLIATVDANVDAILADTGTDGVVLADNAVAAAKVATGAIDADAIAATAANKIADHTIRRDWESACDSADGDTKDFRSLLGAIAKLVNKIAPNNGNIEIFEDDDTTVLGTQTPTTDSGADPITAMDTV